jgi:hypothetical protein
MFDTREEQESWVDDMCKKYSTTMSNKEIREWEIYGTIPETFMDRLSKAKRKQER